MGRSLEAEMAIKGAIQMGQDDVFPDGSFVVGDVAPLRDFDRSTKDQAVHAVDRDTGVLLWTFDGLTATPYVATTASGRGRLAWSFRATEMRALGRVPAGVGNGKAS
jgi:hypothetical protein